MHGSLLNDTHLVAKILVKLNNAINTCFIRQNIIGLPSYRGSYKITVVCLSVSVHLSVRSTFFSGIAH